MEKGYISGPPNARGGGRETTYLACGARSQKVQRFCHLQPAVKEQERCSFHLCLMVGDLCGIPIEFQLFIVTLTF